MDLVARKYAFIRALFKVEEPEVMDKLEQVLREEDAGRDTIEEYNKDLDKAIGEIEKGEFFTQDEVKNMAGKW